MKDSSISIKKENMSREIGHPLLEYSGGRILSGSGDVIVSGVSFSLDAGKSLALIGETGSGKTMTALSVMGLLPYGVKEENDNILFLGKPLPSYGEMKNILGKEIVYIPQNGAESLAPSRTVRKQLYDNLKKLGIPKEELRAAASEKLSLAGFVSPEEILDKYPFQLSGGMCQRVTIALAACSDAKLVIADEPSNGLDDDFAVDFIGLVKSLFPDAAILMITHDISIASQCNYIVVLCGGRVMEKGVSDTVLASPRSPYTRSLISALPENGMKQTPVLRQGSSSCPFFARCPDAEELCLSDPVTSGGDWRCLSR